MTRAALTRVETYSDVLCNGGSRTGLLARRRQTRWRGLLSCAGTLRVDGKDTLTVTAPASNDALADVAIGGVLRLTFADETWAEWRVESVQSTCSQDGVVVATITARALLLDLANVLLRRVEASGVVRLDTGLALATIAEAFAAYVAPALASDGYGWIALGTVDDAARYDMDWTAVTALGFVDYVCHLRAAGPLEPRLRAVGTTGYALDCLYTINGDAPRPDVRARKNLRHYQRTLSTEGMATAVVAIGGTREDGVVSTLAGVVFRIEAIDTTTAELTIADPEGGLPPIAIDGMLDGMVLVSRTGGRGLEVLASDSATQRVTVADVQGKDIGDALLLAAGAPTGRAYPDPFLAGGGFRVPFKVTAVAVGQYFDDLTVADPFGAASVIPTGFRWRDQWLSTGAHVLTTAVSAQAQATQRYTVASVSGVQVGDIGVRTVSASGALDAETDAFTVTDIDAVNLRLTVAPRYTATPIIPTTGALSGFVHLYRLTRTIGIAIAGNLQYVTVAPSSAVAVGDWGEAWVSPAWPQAAALLAPIAKPGASPRRHRLGVVSRPETDEANVLGNGYLSDWDATPTAWPDGLFRDSVTTITAWDGFRQTGRRNTTDLTKIQTGGKSLRLRQARRGFLTADVSQGASAFSASGDPGTSATEPDFEPGAVVGFGSPVTEYLTIATATYSAGHWDYTTTTPFAGAQVTGQQIRELGALPRHRFIMPPVGIITAYASLWMQSGTTALPRLTLSAPTATGISPQSVDGSLVDQWDVIAIEGFEAPAGTLIELAVTFSGVDNNHPRPSLWIDALGVTETSYLPAPLPNYSNGNVLYQAARRFLVERYQGVQSYDMQFLDLTRFDAAAWPSDELLVGAYANLTDPDTGVPVALRMLELRPDYLREAETGITLATTPLTLTSQVG